MEKIRWDKFVENTKVFFTSPNAIYDNFEKTGGYLEPVVYIALMNVFGSMIFSLGSLFSLSNLLLSVIIIPIGLISSFITAAILHFIWVFLGSKETYETSFRCIASIAPLIPISGIVYIIPFIGKWISVFIFPFIFYYFIILASVNVHNVDQEKAKKVFLVLTLIWVFFSFVGNVKWSIYQRKIRKMQKEAEQRMKEYQKQMEEYEKKMKEEYEKQLQQQGNIESQ